MNSTFVEDLIYLFEHSPIGLTYGTNLFKGPKAEFPLGDGPFMSIIKTGGLGAEGTHNSVDGPAYERPTAQLVFRGVDYDPAEALADAVYAFVFPIRNQFINRTWWRELHPRTEPFDLPNDEQDRIRIAFNIECVKRTSPSTS